jgi:hypothetical protein
MAVKRALIAIVCALVAATASAQDVTTEISATAGASSEDVQVAATQARVFGQADRFSFFAEAAWSSSHSRGAGDDSEAFSSAYPYEGPPRVMDAYFERRMDGRRLFGVVRGGRFRTPFGIHDASDYAYNGFLRAPLIRYEGYWALSNSLFEHGVNVMAGTARLQAEVTVGRPGDVSDDFHRRSSTDVVLRAQGYAGPFVIGVSHLDSSGYDLGYAVGRISFTGFDVRWMQGGVQVRTEWLRGRPWSGAETTGGYLDVSVHRTFMGPVTIVGRLETLDYDTADGLYAAAANGTALGTRVKVLPGVFAQVNVTHRPSAPYAPNATATDVALTYTLRARH